MVLIRIEKMFFWVRRACCPFVVNIFQFFMRSDRIEMSQRFRITQLSIYSNPFTHTQAFRAWIVFLYARGDVLISQFIRKRIAAESQTQSFRTRTLPYDHNHPVQSTSNAHSARLLTECRLCRRHHRRLCRRRRSLTSSSSSDSFLAEYKMRYRQTAYIQSFLTRQCVQTRNYTRE